MIILWRLVVKVTCTVFGTTYMRVSSFPVCGYVPEMRRSEFSRNEADPWPLSLNRCQNIIITGAL